MKALRSSANASARRTSILSNGGALEFFCTATSRPEQDLLDFVARASTEQQRLDQSITQIKAAAVKAREAADAARKAASLASFYTALSMLIGAFIDPGVQVDGGKSIRQEEYDALGDRYSKVIVEELLIELKVANPQLVDRSSRWAVVR